MPHNFISRVPILSVHALREGRGDARVGHSGQRFEPLAKDSVRFRFGQIGERIFRFVVAFLGFFRPDPGQRPGALLRAPGAGPDSLGHEP